MAAVLPPLLLLLFFLSLPASAQNNPAVAAMDDASALLLLKSGLVNASALSSWSNSSNPCNTASPWAGIHCANGHVEAVLLNGMNLSGSIDVAALGMLGDLRALSLADNAFSGPIPDFRGLQGIKALYISGNKFSGEIPDDLFDGMDHLKKLWLSGNNFSGPIPASLAEAPSLIELRLEDNRFTGTLPALAADSLKQFNIANNALAGPVPESLARFNATAFAGNAELCGPPLAGQPCSAPLDRAAPTPPKSSGAGMEVVVVALAAAAAIVVAAMFTSRRREMGSVVLGMGDGGRVAVRSTSSSSYRSGGVRAESKAESVEEVAAAVEREREGLVMVNEERVAMGLADLMRAAAETLGTGGLGTAYKVAVGEGGAAVVVKRMRGMNLVGRETFEVEMRRVGRLRHRNVLPPLAYHYRREEKLLVYDFLPNGTLLDALHSNNRGPQHVALNWATRLKILRGIVRGLAHIHAELASHDVPHGNLKSSNVLLAADFEPLLVDFGFVPLVNPSLAAQTLLAYRSPEALRLRHVSPKSDVYCLGILILELLTGRFPLQCSAEDGGGTDVVAWVSAAVKEGRDLAALLDPAIACEKSAVPAMERMLRVGASCAEPDLSMRPSVSEAATRISEAAA